MVTTTIIDTTYIKDFKRIIKINIITITIQTMSTAFTNLISLKKWLNITRVIILGEYGINKEEATTMEESETGKSKTKTAGMNYSDNYEYNHIRITKSLMK